LSLTGRGRRREREPFRVFLSPSSSGGGGGSSRKKLQGGLIG